MTDRRLPRHLLALMAMLLACAIALPAQAQNRKRAGGGKKSSIERIVARNFFSPAQVARHRDELKLSDKQVKQLKQLVKDHHSKKVDIEFEMQDQSKTLAGLLRAPKPNEAKILAQADRYLKLENKIKRLHLQILLRTRGVLSDVQAKKLLALRRKRRQERRKRRRGELD